MGCGGSGDNGGGGGGGGGAASIRVFATDDPITNYQSVWVTIQKIELIGSGGTQTVFSSSTGEVIDLASLNKDGTSLFELLGIASIPSGTYTSVKVTMAETVTLVPKGGGATETATFANSQNGVVVVSFDLNEHLANRDNLILDFDLQHWTVDNGIVTPVIKKGVEDGLSDEHRQNTNQFEGTVTNLSGSGTSLSFDLRTGNGSIHITVTDATSIYNDSGKSNPTLQNGTRVHVRGKFDVGTNSVVASSISIQGQNGDNHEDEAIGTVGTVDTSAHTFLLTLEEAEHFMPNADTITVATTTETVFVDRGGVTMTQDEFYTWLTSNANAATVVVEVEGSYNADTKTFNATQVKVETGDDSGGTHESEVGGTVSNLDTTAHTFTVTVNHFEGEMLHVGDTLTVTVDDSTAYYGSHHTTLTRDEFFAQVSNSATVEVRGTLSGTTLLATSIKLDDGMG